MFYPQDMSFAASFKQNINSVLNFKKRIAQPNNQRYTFQKTRGKGNRFPWFNKQYRKTNAHSPQYVEIDRIIRHPDYTEGNKNLSACNFW